MTTTTLSTNGPIQQHLIRHHRCRYWIHLRVWRISRRPILTCDGGLEKLVQLLRDFCLCPPPPESPSIMFGPSPPGILHLLRHQHTTQRFSTDMQRTVLVLPFNAWSTSVYVVGTSPSACCADWDIGRSWLRVGSMASIEGLCCWTFGKCYRRSARKSRATSTKASVTTWATTARACAGTSAPTCIAKSGDEWGESLTAISCFTQLMLC